MLMDIFVLNQVLGYVMYYARACVTCGPYRLCFHVRFIITIYGTPKYMGDSYVVGILM